MFPSSRRRPQPTPAAALGAQAAAQTTNSLLWGQGVALVIRDSDGGVRELHRLLPPAVNAQADPLTSVHQYGLGEAGAAGQSELLLARDPPTP